MMFKVHKFLVIWSFTVDKRLFIEKVPFIAPARKMMKLPPNFFFSIVFKNNADTS